MYEFEQAKKLDTVLRYMAKAGEPRFEKALDIAKGIDAKKSEWTELYLILNKLVKDEFIEVQEKEQFKQSYVSLPPVFEKEYIITFEGLYQIESGGYLQRTVEQNADKIELAKQKIQADTAKAYQREQADTLNRLTKWIVVGAIIASGYYLYYLIQPILDLILKKK